MKAARAKYIERYELLLSQKTDEAIAAGIKADFIHPNAKRPYLPFLSGAIAIMYNKILVALDTLEPVVFETALSIAIATQADLLLLHVLTEHDADSPPAPIPIAWDYASPLSQDSWDA